MRNASSTRVLTGSGSGSGSAPVSSAGLRERGSSISASGLPVIPATSRARTSGASGTGAWSSRSDPAASASRPATRISGMPAVENAVGSPSRTATRRAIPSAPRRRARKTSASVEASSSHCPSLTRQSTGRCSASSESRLRTASETRKRLSPDPAASPRATRSACACGGARPSTCARTGRRSWCSPAKGSSASDWIPCARRTVIPAASARAASSRADLPTPGSPPSISARLRERRASSSTCPMSARSRSRPRSMARS